MVETKAGGAAAALLAGRCAIVATPGLALGGALARGLRRHGARVVEVELAPPRTIPAAPIESLPCSAVVTVMFSLAVPTSVSVSFEKSSVSSL